MLAARKTYQILIEAKAMGIYFYLYRIFLLNTATYPLAPASNTITKNHCINHISFDLKKTSLQTEAHYRFF